VEEDEKKVVAMIMAFIATMTIPKDE